ncbi:MAG: HepT-like ribonuclease domain-containing protein [Candidatus Tyrphobacter sp.]
MRLEAKKYLFDIREAASRIDGFVDGKQFADYERDPMLSSAVERNFEILGEAPSQLSKVDPGIATRISEYRRIVAFRNILIHGYAEVDHNLVWDVVETKLPTLRREVEALLRNAENKT